MNEIDQLKTYMSEHQLKQYELAAKIGAPTSTVTRWLKGRPISPAYRRLLRVLKIVK